MNTQIFDTTIDSILYLGQIDTKDEKAVASCIDALERFDATFTEFIDSELQVLAQHEIVPMSTRLEEIRQIFADAISEIKNHEGVDFYRTESLLKLCFRLLAFFMSFVYDHNDLMGGESDRGKLVKLLEQ